MKKTLIGFCLFGSMILLTSCGGIIKAVNSGSIAEVEQAISKGDDLNKRDDEGNTPIILAAKHGDTAIVHILAKKGADVKAKNNDGYDALLALANYSMLGSTGTAKDGQAPEPIGITLEGHLKTAEYLLSEKADANARTKDGSTALMLAAQLNKKSLVELLLQNGAEVNAVNQDGRTALMLASMKGQREVICPLIRKGADLQMKDKDGNTAMQYAEKYGRLEIMQRLSSPCPAGTASDAKEGGNVSKSVDKKLAADLQMEKLIEALHNQDLSVRTDAARKLGEMNDARAVVPLINAMNDDHSYVRRRAAVSLGNLRDLRAVESLVKALHDEDPFVRNYSIEALEKITGQQFGTNIKQWQEWWNKSIRQN